MNGLPDRKGRWDFPDDPPVEAEGKRGLDMRKMRKAVKRRAVPAKTSGKFKISADGEDAVLLFGKHKGKEVSLLAKKEPDYLKWMQRQEFPEELLSVVQHQLIVNDRLKNVAPMYKGKGEVRCVGVSSLPPEHSSCRSSIIIEDDLCEDEEKLCPCGFNPDEHVSEYEFTSTPTIKEFNAKLRKVHRKYHNPWRRKGKTAQERIRRIRAGNEFEKKQGWI